MKENFGLDLSPFKITMSQVKLMKQKEVKKGRKYTKTLKIKNKTKPTRLWTRVAKLKQDKI